MFDISHMGRLNFTGPDADAFLDYAEHRRGNMSNARLALDNGLAIVGRLYKADPESGEVRRLYERALRIAVAAP